MAQDSRIIIKGSIMSDSIFVDNTHIVNKNSNKGSISNNYGEFSISVKENDTLLISGIQYYNKIIIPESAGNDIDFSGTQIDLEPELNFVTTITRASSDLDLKNINISKILNFLRNSRIFEARTEDADTPE